MNTIDMEPVDGCTATAHVAYAMCDTAYIYPITPSSPMAEQASLWASNGVPNINGQTVLVTQMQSEAGCAGALHGALTSGSVATTFTSSQGLLLMIPNMYKIAGELLPCVIHVGARTVATHALSIFGDHTDIYAVRNTGFAFLCSSSVQESCHMAIAAHAATLTSSVPFVHFLDGFRTTHEIQKVALPTLDQMKACIDQNALAAFRGRRLNPDHPVQRGTSQNPDVFFQATEANRPTFEHVVQHIIAAFETVHKVFGVLYKPYEFFGADDATDVVVCMGSGSEVVKSTVAHLNQKGKKVGLVKIRMYRPFSTGLFCAALPRTVRRIAVLDRGEDIHAAGDPLFEDVCTALAKESRTVERVIGGVYGLSSKEFNPEHCVAVFENLQSPTPMSRFTVGINDDVSHRSLPPCRDTTFKNSDALPAGTQECVFWGIGGDGTVGANKTAIKLIAKHTSLHTQGYFSYDANKSGGLTLSHLRFGPTPFEAPYLISESDYCACHNPSYVKRFRVTANTRNGSTFLLNCPWKTTAELEQHLPASMLHDIATKHLNMFVIDASTIADECGLGSYVNMVLQTAFFRLSNVMPWKEAIDLLKKSVRQMYSRKGEEMINKNIRAIDMSCASDRLIKVAVPETWAKAPDEKAVTGEFTHEREPFDRLFKQVLQNEGNNVPVSQFPTSGETPSGTSKLGKRGVATRVPHWDSSKCIQCNMCSFVCPHAVIRPYLLDKQEQASAPSGLQSIPARKHEDTHKLVIGASILDCTGCSVCAETCPPKCLHMTPLAEEVATQGDNVRFLLEEVKAKPEFGSTRNVGEIGFLPPYLEYPGSCPGCGETPLVRLVTQLFGSRMTVAAATGCNSIWGGSFPSNPYCTDAQGRGPAWANSLFEDAAELGLGMVTSVTHHRAYMRGLVRQLLSDSSHVPADLQALLEEWQSDPVFTSFERSREVGDKIRDKLKDLRSNPAIDERVKELDQAQFDTAWGRQSFWIIGGDGWAYDIGFGGLDHVLASGVDINILVLDTEVYSNTGGQKSKATPLGAQAKFAPAGKDKEKKDLGRIAMAYKDVYVASVAQGANMQHCLNALKEAEAHPGPSIIIAYTPCIEHHLVHGMKDCMKVQRLAVETGYWILYRRNPANVDKPLTIDSRKPSKDPAEYMATQGRFVALQHENPEHAKELQTRFTHSLAERYEEYQGLAQAMAKKSTN